MPLSPWRLRYFVRKWKRLLYDLEITKRFAEAIKTGDLNTVNAIYSDPKQKMRINPFYKDCDRNSLLHLAVMQGRWHFVTPVENLGCLNNIENNQGKMPFDLTSYFRGVVGNTRPEPGPFTVTGGKVATRDALVEEMSDYYRENFSGAIYPGRRLTADLNLYFECEEGRCELPDSWPELNAIDTRWLSLHQRLAMANHLGSARATTSVEEMTPADETSNCYVTAALTFVVSENPYTRDRPVSMKAVVMPVNVPEYMIYSIGTEYAHAEQMLFAYLQAEGVFTRIANELKVKIGGSNGHKCYSVIFDLHSTYNMCGKCEGRMYEFQGLRGENSLLAKCESALTENGFILPSVRQHADLLTPSTARLFTSTRVSCHASFPHQEPRDDRGDKYRTFEGASITERNVATHRSAVVFHAAPDGMRRYRFSSEARGDFVPSFVPKQTAFVMKPDPKTSSAQRRSLSRPHKYEDAANAGILIYSSALSRSCNFKATPYFLWQYVKSGELEIVKRLITEKRGDRDALAVMLISTHAGQNIFHKAAASNNTDMLDYINTVLLAHFSDERERLILAQPCLLSMTGTPEVFLKLIELGALDEQGEYIATIFNELDRGHKERIVDVYTGKGWNIEFATDFLASRFLLSL